MDIGLQHFRQGIMNHAMPLDPAFARKCGRSNLNFEMAFPVLRTGVAGMQVALVLHQQVTRVECRAQKLVDPRASLLSHGRTSLNGLTVTLE